MQNYLNKDNKDSVSEILGNPEAKVVLVGSRPITERALKKFKLAAAFASSVTAGFAISMSALMGINTEDTAKLTALNLSNLPVAQAQELEANNHQLGVKNSNKQVSVSNTENKVNNIRQIYPEVNFDKIQTSRDVAREFVGINTFMALAAEMEGFRGDLHRDPGVGLNIGFGYNITKRFIESPDKVWKEMRAINLDDKLIKKIIDLSQTPQPQLGRAIREFNKEHNFPNNQLITIEQGVGLLKATQQEYREQATRAIGDSFHNMARDQQDVLTYAAYKVGEENLSKYRNTIRIINRIYDEPRETTMAQRQQIAENLVFFYRLNGGEWTRDTRADLIGDTFVSPYNLAKVVGSDIDKTITAQQLARFRPDFSDRPMTPSSARRDATNLAVYSVNNNLTYSVAEIQSRITQVRQDTVVQSSIDNKPSKPKY